MKNAEAFEYVDGLVSSLDMDLQYSWEKIKSALQGEDIGIHSKEDVIEHLKNGDYNFTLDEFCIEGEDNCPDDIAVKIFAYHIEDLQVGRDKLGIPIICSEKSGYRSKAHERKKGRNGRSQHTFDEEIAPKGAADLRSNNLSNTKKLLKWLVDESEYTYIAYYPEVGFAHCDHRGDIKTLFTSTPNSKWTRVSSLSKYYE